MKKIILFMTTLLVLGLTGCESKREINYEEEDLYAIAYIGYDNLDNLSKYEEYIDIENLDRYYLSNGEYYLVIPRYDNMTLEVKENDIITLGAYDVAIVNNSKPFLIRGNESDIFSNITLKFIYNDTEYSFTPYQSLKDGSFAYGDRGVNITKE